MRRNRLKAKPPRIQVPQCSMRRGSSRIVGSQEVWGSIFSWPLYLWKMGSRCSCSAGQTAFSSRLATKNLGSWAPRHLGITNPVGSIGVHQLTIPKWHLMSETSVRGPHIPARREEACHLSSIAPPAAGRVRSSMARRISGSEESTSSVGRWILEISCCRWEFLRKFCWMPGRVRVRLGG